MTVNGISLSVTLNKIWYKLAYLIDTNIAIHARDGRSPQKPTDGSSRR